MRHRPDCYAIVMICTLLSPAYADQALEVTASIPTARVDPQAAAKQALVPGALEYTLKFKIYCEHRSVPLSLSVGVADTREFFDLAANEDASRFETTFVVPGEQIAPTVTQDFCVSADTGTHARLLVKDLLTAQISLRCGGETSSTMHYLSQPLSVRLDCEGAKSDQEVDSTDK